MRVLALPLLVLSLPASAQFWSRLANPTVEVQLRHPPELGLRLDRAALAPPRNASSRELADALLAALVQSGGVVFADPAATGPAGPAFLLEVDVARDEVKHEEAVKEDKERDGRVKSTTRTATTQLEYSATVRLVELASGRLHDVVRVDERPRASSSSDKAMPPHPDASPLRRQVREEALARALKQLLPWTEVLKITYFDDKKYGMDEAFKRLESGDRRGAWDLARRGAESARADTRGEAKFRGRAIHNLGVLTLQEGRPAEAQALFQEARDLLPDASIFKDAVKDAQRAAALAEALARYEALAPAKASQGKDGARSPEQRLESLDRLRRKGLITEAEYQARKAEILREL